MFSELFPPFKCTDRRLPSVCSLAPREGIPLVPLAARIPPGSVRSLFPARGRAGAGVALAGELSCVGSRLLLPHSGSCASLTNTVSKPRDRGGQCPDLGRSCRPSVPGATGHPSPQTRVDFLFKLLEDVAVISSILLYNICSLQ